MAVDAFGEAVVIPMFSILKEVKSCLTVIRVCLLSAQVGRKIAASHGAHISRVREISQPLSEAQSRTRLSLLILNILL